jgi:serine/threonine-protein kinase RsbT
LKKETKQVFISQDIDVASAALEARKYAETIGFNKGMQYMISTAVSELARNIFAYAKEGTINLKVLNKNSVKGIEVIAEDQGPGIENIENAMKDHFSTGGTMGVGLPGTKRLMDEFEIETQRPGGTKITIRKWIQ